MCDEYVRVNVFSYTMLPIHTSAHVIYWTWTLGEHEHSLWAFFQGFHLTHSNTYIYIYGDKHEENDITYCMHMENICVFIFVYEGCKYVYVCVFRRGRKIFSFLYYTLVYYTHYKQAQPPANPLQNSRCEQYMYMYIYKRHVCIHICVLGALYNKNGCLAVIFEMICDMERYFVQSILEKFQSLYVVVIVFVLIPFYHYMLAYASATLCSGRAWMYLYRIDIPNYIMLCGSCCYCQTIWPYWIL